MDVPRSPQLLYQNFIFKKEVVLEVANFCEMLYSWGICIFTAGKKNHPSPEFRKVSEKELLLMQLMLLRLPGAGRPRGRKE